MDYANAYLKTSMDNKNIILVGFMGTGKTTVGKLLAATLHREFVDMDALIEERQNMTVSQIFTKYGAEYFRALENMLVTALSNRTNLVIAAGGGAILNPENLHSFNTTGHVICLTATPATIASRLNNTQARPLLADAAPSQILERIEQLLANRQLAYMAVPLQVATDTLSPEEVAHQIQKILANQS